jgi:aspartate racemase
MSQSETWKTVGILGGMGAEAGVELARRLIYLSGARTDSEQIPCLLYTNPCVPDRTENLLHGGPSPLDELVRSLQVLVDAGAELVCIPCNTAHAWHEELSRRIDVPVVHMIRAMARHHDRLRGDRVGVLCTTGLTRVGLYQSCCAEQNLEAIMPTEEELEGLVMRAIYGDLDRGLVGLKGSNKDQTIVRLMWEAGQRLIDRGASAVWLACTEISLIKEELIELSPVPVVDAMDVLGEELVRLARRDAGD